VPENGLRLARAEFDRTAAGTPRERRRMDKVSQTPKRVLGEPVGAGTHLSAVLAIGAWRQDSDPRPALLNSSSLGGTHTSLVLAPAPHPATEPRR
jgi:hypothetical protein